MELHEPKQKKRVRLQPQQPLPIIFDEDGNLIKFTAHLSALGTVIDEPDDMAAVQSMGFFGKGTLSRSYPTFGRARYGAPPVVRKRQWVRRMTWVEEVKQLSLESYSQNEKEDSTEEEATAVENLPSTYNKMLIAAGLSGNRSQSSSIFETSKVQDNSPEIMDSIEIIEEKNGKFGKPASKRITVSRESSEIELLELTNNEPPRKTMKLSNMEVDERIPNSTEDEEIYEIPREESNGKKSQDNSDIICQQEEMDFSSGDENEYVFEGKVLVLPDSDSETENYLTDIRPRIKTEGFPVKETLHLTFEETFFLMFGLGCLEVVDIQGKIMSIKKAWDHFCKEDEFFVQKYVVYHYYRSKGWVVKPGLKYGGDFLLYKQGPPFYHASYIVIIDVVDSVTLKRIEEKAIRKMKMKNIIGMDRLSEAAAKEILLTQVLWPDSIPMNNYTSAIVNLSHFTINEILWRRWRINKTPKTSNYGQSDEDEDSS